MTLCVLVSERVTVTITLSDNADVALITIVAPSVVGVVVVAIVLLVSIAITAKLCIMRTSKKAGRKG